ncbi:unnamed protein product [Blepharisma stoltei]|uniref:Alcohol dehydrogenase n=1 Tax=Blepharisma stoltei TaxID=1481888 RepID=A0AAU9IFM6_9CILI|nr:unnamed protein product [Blepharisma stoltei]
MTGEIYEILQEPGKLYVYGFLSERFCSISPLILDTKKKIRGLSLYTWLKNASTLKKYKVWNKVQELYEQIFKIDYKETIGIDRLKDALSAYKDRKTNAKVLVRVKTS